MQAILAFALTTLQFLVNIVLSANAETYAIPLSLNPIIQSPIELSATSNTFYKQDRDFYSNVTLTDVSHDTHQDLKEIVPKKLSVVIYTVASSYIGGTLKKSDLKYLSGSKWSYSIPVEELIAASEGSITKLNQEMELYVFQELGMKFLEKRYNFNMSDIQNQLGLSLMEFFGASEEQWIKIVGFITEEMINRRRKELGLTPCYLAELLNKTEKDIAAFTLNQVDEHIYNISSLQKKLPEFKETVLTTTFNVTPADLANLSGLNITMTNSMGLQDQIQLLTNSILQRFHLSIDEIATKYKRSSDDILTPCPDEWRSVQTLVVKEAFEKQATNMSLANKTLASLIQIPYPNISKLSLDQMEHLIDTKIREVKEKKNVIEQKKLDMLMNTGNQSDVVNLEENAFSIIEAVTNFSKSELSLIYGWDDSHYLFAEMFSVADLVHSCSSKLHNHTLFELAKINAGEDSGMCNTFSALRKIWEKATVNEIEQRFGNQLSNSTIENMLLSLTGGNLIFINRVLNLSADARVLCANVTLDHISMATSHPTMHLKQMSFQYIIDLAEELKANGTLFQSAKVTTPISPMTSRIVSSMHISIKPTATTKTKALMATRNKTHTVLPQYSSTKVSTDNNNATRIANSTVTIGSVNVTIQHNSTNIMMTTRIIVNSTSGPTSSSGPTTSSFGPAKSAHKPLIKVSPMTSRIVSSMDISIKPTATTKTKALMATRNKTHTVLPQYSSTKVSTDNNNATRIANSTVTIGSVNVTIQHNSTNIKIKTRIIISSTSGPTSSSGPTTSSFGPAKSAHKPLIKGSILMLILFASMYLALV